MQISDLLNQLGGIDAIARELGVDESKARSGAEALLPAILGGFKQQAQAQPGGTGGLLDMLGSLGGKQGSAGGLGGMLDADGDGNPVNDVMGMLGKFKR